MHSNPMAEPVMGDGALPLSKHSPSEHVQAHSQRPHGKADDGRQRVVMLEQGGQMQNRAVATQGDAKVHGVLAGVVCLDLRGCERLQQV